MLKTIFENRKDLVKAVSDFAKQPSQYLGAPSFAYKVGDFIIDRDGCITSDSEMGDLKESLIKKGFIEQETDGLEFSVPLNGADKQAVINLVNMLYSRQYLINRALGITVLDISEDFVSQIRYREILNFDGLTGFRIDGDNLVFTYPDVSGGEKLKAYMTMVCMAFAKAKESKRVQPKLMKPENEKYYMRSWLIRIGLDGKGGAETRKILLQSLKGHSAFRTEAEIERAKEKYKQKKGL